jgi:hypothetical protein
MIVLGAIPPFVTFVTTLVVSAYVDPSVKTLLVVGGVAAGLAAIAELAFSWANPGKEHDSLDENPIPVTFGGVTIGAFVRLCWIFVWMIITKSVKYLKT